MMKCYIVTRLNVVSSSYSSGPKGMNALACKRQRLSRWLSWKFERRLELEKMLFSMVIVHVYLLSIENPYKIDCRIYPKRNNRSWSHHNSIIHQVGSIMMKNGSWKFEGGSKSQCETFSLSRRRNNARSSIKTSDINYFFMYLHALLILWFMLACRKDEWNVCYIATERATHTERKEKK